MKNKLLLVYENERELAQVEKVFQSYGIIFNVPFELTYEAIAEMECWNRLPDAVIIIDPPADSPIYFLGETTRKFLDSLLAAKADVYRCGGEEVREEWYIKLPPEKIIPQLAKECGYCKKLFVGKSYTCEEIFPSEEYCSEECLECAFEALQDEDDFGYYGIEI